MKTFAPRRTDFPIVQRPNFSAGAQALAAAAPPCAAKNFHIAFAASAQIVCPSPSIGHQATGRVQPSYDPHGLTGPAAVVAAQDCVAR
jgi:hypothetical protein